MNSLRRTKIEFKETKVGNAYTNGGETTNEETKKEVTVKREE